MREKSIEKTYRSPDQVIRDWMQSQRFLRDIDTSDGETRQARTHLERCSHIGHRIEVFHSEILISTLIGFRADAGDLLTQLLLILWVPCDFKQQPVQARRARLMSPECQSRHLRDELAIAQACARVRRGVCSHCTFVRKYSVSLSNLCSPRILMMSVLSLALRTLFASRFSSIRRFETRATVCSVCLNRLSSFVGMYSIYLSSSFGMYRHKAWNSMANCEGYSETSELRRRVKRSHQ